MNSLTKYASTLTFISLIFLFDGCSKKQSISQSNSIILTHHAKTKCACWLDSGKICIAVIDSNQIRKLLTFAMPATNLGGNIPLEIFESSDTTLNSGDTTLKNGDTTLKVNNGSQKLLTDTLPLGDTCIAISCGGPWSSLTYLSFIPGDSPKAEIDISSSTGPVPPILVAGPPPFLLDPTASYVITPHLDPGGGTMTITSWISNMSGDNIGWAAGANSLTITLNP